MAERRRPVEISLERTVSDPGAGGPLIVRVSATLEEGAASGPAELGAEVQRLRTALDLALTTLQPSGAALVRPDRPLGELIEAYRPRQPELVDLLRDEGELTANEHELLRRHLLAAEAPRPPPAGVPITDRPIAAAPLEADRAPTTPRSVEELLRVYQIASLKQAGAVRARRQISFEEYMLLKRHFASLAPGPTSP